MKGIAYWVSIDNQSLVGAAGHRHSEIVGPPIRVVNTSPGWS